MMIGACAIHVFIPHIIYRWYPVYTSLLRFLCARQYRGHNFFIFLYFNYEPASHLTFFLHVFPSEPLRASKNNSNSWPFTPLELYLCIPFLFSYLFILYASCPLKIYWNVIIVITSLFYFPSSENDNTRIK